MKSVKDWLMNLSIAVVGGCIGVGLLVGSELVWCSVKAQDKQAKAAASVAADTKPKSYPLPEALSTQINKLVIARDAAREAFLQYVTNPTIYSDNETLRAASFDRQEKLLTSLQKSNEAINSWITKQREEFKCPSCNAVQKPNSDKWYFEEPTTNATTAK